MASYNFSKTTNFTVSTVILSELQNDVLISSISSATLLYINEVDDTITFYFSGTLSGPDQTTLSNLCTNYAVDPRPTSTGSTSGDSVVAGGLGVGSNIWVGSAFTATNITVAGSIFNIPSFTYTCSTISPANVNIASINQVTIAETNTTTTIANAASLYIAGAPLLGTNVSAITNPYALQIAAGKTFIGGALQIPTGAVNGYVLTSDASGNASWTVAAAGFSGFSDGTASLPGAYFTSQTGTGFYRPASGQIGVELAGANYVLFKTTGTDFVNNSIVNIGTSGSTSFLNVYGSAEFLGSGNTTASLATIYSNPASTAITGASQYYFNYFEAPTTVPTTFTGTASTVFINGPPTSTTGGTGLALNIKGNTNITNTGSTLKIITNAIGGAGTWIDLDTTGPSAIGTGGAGSNCMIGYAANAGNYFTDAITGDFVYRNGSSRLCMGTNGNKIDLIFGANSYGLLCTNNFRIINTTLGEPGGIAVGSANDNYAGNAIPFSDTGMKAFYLMGKYVTPGTDGMTASATNLTNTGGVAIVSVTDTTNLVAQRSVGSFNNGTGAASTFLQATSLGTNITGMTSTAAGFSISFWTYVPTAYSTVIAPILSLDTATGAAAGVIGIFRAATTGILTFVLRTSGGAIYVQAAESSAPRVNTWNHYIITMTSTGTAMYKNNVLQILTYATGTSSTAYQSTTVTRFTVGAGAAIGTTGYTGYIGSLIFSSTIWSAAQILQIYSFQLSALATPSIVTYGSKSIIGSALEIPSVTFTDNSTAASGTAANLNLVSINQPTYNATNTNVITTRPATMYIEGAPIRGTNETFSNLYGLYIDSVDTCTVDAAGIAASLCIASSPIITTNATNLALMVQGGNSVFSGRVISNGDNSTNSILLLPFTDANLYDCYSFDISTNLGLSRNSAGATNLTNTGTVTYTATVKDTNGVQHYNIATFSGAAGTQFLQSTSLGADMTTMFSAAGGFSVRLWVNRTATQTVASPIICADNNSAASFAFYAYLDTSANSNVFRIILKNTSGTTYLNVAETVAPVVNTWNAYTFTISAAGGNNIYKNGIQLTGANIVYTTGTSATNYTALTTITRFTIGANSVFLASAGWLGHISDIIMSGTVWTDAQVSSTFGFQQGAVTTDSLSVYGGKTTICGNLQIPVNPTRGYVLTSDAIGGATWQPSSVSFTAANTGNIAGATNTTPANITGMTLTPTTAGTYWVIFTTVARVSNSGRTLTTQLALNGTLITNTNAVTVIATAVDDRIITTQGIVAVNGTTDVITAQAGVSANSYNLPHFKSLTALKIF